MTFSDSIKICFDKYATMKGRAPRSEYWWFVAFCWLVMVLSALLFAFIGMKVNSNGKEGMAIAVIGGETVVSLCLFLPGLCVLVRRLHDTGHSGWWYFISFVPVVGGLWMLWLLLLGSDEENEYGLPVY